MSGMLPDAIDILDPDEKTRYIELLTVLANADGALVREEMAALEALHRAEVAQKHVTGLLYFNPGKPTLDETLNLVETPLAELPDERLKPSRESLEELLAGFRS